jgi:hypothetical protein
MRLLVAGRSKEWENGFGSKMAASPHGKRQKHIVLLMVYNIFKCIFNWCLNLSWFVLFPHSKLPQSRFHLTYGWDYVRFSICCSCSNKSYHSILVANHNRFPFCFVCKLIVIWSCPCIHKLVALGTSLMA